MSAFIKKLATRQRSRNLIADYKPFTMVDGEGFRCAVFVSGCVFNCEGCYNKSIQDFGNGRFVYDQDFEDQVIKDLQHPGIQGLTLLGGEPLLNPDVCLSLMRRVRAEFGTTRDIWVWTGYTYEELLESIGYQTAQSKKQAEMLTMMDRLVDGRFDITQKDLTGKLRFRGSWNQRIINVPESIDKNTLVLVPEYIEG